MPEENYEKENKHFRKISSEERKNLYNSILEEGESKFVAGFHSWRYYLFSRTPIIYLANKAHSKWAEPLSKEEDPKKLVKKNITGKLEVLASYPIAIGSITTFLLTGEPWYAAGVPFGTYLNWKGELEMDASEKRIQELDIDWEKTVDEMFKKYEKKR